MKRIITRIALVSLLAGGLTTSCSDDPENPVGPGPLPIPEYKNLTQKDMSF